MASGTAYWDEVEARPAVRVARQRTRPKRRVHGHRVYTPAEPDIPTDLVVAGVLTIVEQVAAELERTAPARERHPCTRCGQLAAMWWEALCLRCHAR